MALVLGSTTAASGCVTRLVDIINRSPSELEDLVGYRRGRLAQGFYLLLLKHPLSAGDFEFFGYTYMSGGKIGSPSNVEAIENARPRVHDVLARSLHSAGPTVAPTIDEQFAKSIPLSGPNRYVKIVAFIGHDDHIGAADQYPASKLGIAQLNLKKAKKKDFLVAAEVHGSIWTLANSAHAKIDVGARPRYDLPYDQDPRRKVMAFLSNA